jgi:hypothetical protein
MNVDEFSKDILNAICEERGIDIPKTDATNIAGLIAKDEEYDFMSLVYEGIMIDGKITYIVPDKYLMVIPINKERGEVAMDLMEEFECEHVDYFDGFGEYKLFYICW